MTGLPPLRQEDAVPGVRIGDRFRPRQGTLAFVRYTPGCWPELEVRWDDRPASLARVTPYTIGVLGLEDA